MFICVSEQTISWNMSNNRQSWQRAQRQLRHHPRRFQLDSITQISRVQRPRLDTEATRASPHRNVGQLLVETTDDQRDIKFEQLVGRQIVDVGFQETLEELECGFENCF